VSQKKRMPAVLYEGGRNPHSRDPSDRRIPAEQFNSHRLKPVGSLRRA
jgi:hypothetical protein